MPKYTLAQANALYAKVDRMVHDLDLKLAVKGVGHALGYQGPTRYTTCEDLLLGLEAAVEAYRLKKEHLTLLEQEPTPEQCLKLHQLFGQVGLATD